LERLDQTLALFSMRYGLPAHLMFAPKYNENNKVKKQPMPDVFVRNITHTYLEFETSIYFEAERRLDLEIKALSQEQKTELQTREDMIARFYKKCSAPCHGHWEGEACVKCYWYIRDGFVL
jgi:hypothetical protein